MALPAATTVLPEEVAPSATEPLLEAGDRLTRDEFERRYQRVPHVKKAELIEGTVYMPSPVRARKHAIPHGHLGGWLVLYASETPGVECADNSTVRLDLDNEPQPDLVLMKLPDKGGQARISADDYIEGAPELAVEIVGSSRAYDLHQKKGATAATQSGSTWLGLWTRIASSGGNCGTETIKRLFPRPADYCRAASSLAFGWTRPRSGAAT